VALDVSRRAASPGLSESLERDLLRIIERARNT
jgi:hypothetical protein